MLINTECQYFTEQFPLSIIIIKTERIKEIMKCLLLRKWTICFFFGLLLSSMLPGFQVKAEETAEAVLDDSGILQSGGLLQEEEALSPLRVRSSGNTAGARKALTNAIDRIASTVDLTSYQITTSELKSLLSSAVNNNPKYFYYKSCSYTYSPSNNQAKVVTLRYSGSAAAIRPQIAAYEQAVQNILGNVQSSWSSFEKAMYVNDYLALNCRYDSTYSKYSAYNALVEGTAVCQGYGLAYQELMGRLNIPCQLVSSDPLNHAWNLIQINGSWYHVDVTWNDPVSDRPGRARHLYLLKSTGWFQSTGKHIQNGKTDYVYSNGATDASASSQVYDNYFWNDIDSPFGYYNGSWYTNNGNVLYRYQFNSTGMTGSSILKALNQRWPVFNGSGTWGGTYGGCIVYGSKLYYASPTSIQVLDLTNPAAAEKTVFTLPSDQQNRGYIYGFHIDSDGKLFYGLSDSPNTAPVTYSQPLHTHTYGSWTVTKAATCTENGQRQQACTDCGTVKTESIAATGHLYGDWKITKAATCTENGQRQQVCSNCKTAKTESIAATGHLHQKTTTTAATFKKTGKTVVTCQDCNTVLKSKTIAKIKCKKGKTYTVGNYKYKIVSAKTNGKGTVSFVGLAKNVKKVTIGDTVKILGVKFKIVQIGDKALKNKTSVTSVTIGKNVTSIGKEAFYGTKKLKTITIKSTRITKVGSNAFKKVYSKAKIKVPKTKLKKYKTLMKSKGQKSTVKIAGN